MTLGLSEKDLEDRKNFVGGSDAKIIMAGTPREVQELIDTKRGDRPNKRLEHVLAVQMGIVTEDLNRRWFSRQTGNPVTCAGKRRYHPDRPWMAVTLDGMTFTSHGKEAVFEAKHTGERSTVPQLVERYFWQVQHQMAVTGTRWAVLSMFFGNGTWDMAEIEYDAVAAWDMIAREEVFWDCRLTGKPWPDLPEPPHPDIESILKASKPVDMSRNNRWCAIAPKWRELHGATAEFKALDAELKALVDRRARKCHGSGIIGTVSKDGSVRLKPDPDWVEQTVVVLDAAANDDDDELTF